MVAGSLEELVAHPGIVGGKVSNTARRAAAYVREHYSEPIARSDLAAALGVSENYLTDLFHREMGVSLWTYLNRYRIKQAKALLVSTELKITEIASRVGFDDPAYFSRVFRRYTGRSPRAFRKSTPSVEVVGA
jgi:YesN/AraC family two-component response regulator